MSAKHYVEDELVRLLGIAEAEVTRYFPEGLRLNVPIIAARSGQKRPADYLAVRCADEDQRAEDLWMVHVEFWSIAQADDPVAAELSKQRIRKISRWLGDGCPARRHGTQHIFISGIFPRGTAVPDSDRSQADVFQADFGTQVYNC